MSEIVKIAICVAVGVAMCGAMWLGFRTGFWLFGR